MFYLIKVLIGRTVSALDRPFSYWTDDESIKKGMRVLVRFGPSKSTIGFVIEEPERIDTSLEEYQNEKGIKLSKIQKSLDEEPILDNNLMNLATAMAKYYKCELIRVLQTMLPPSLKPKDSALNKSHGRTIDFVFALPLGDTKLTKKESDLYKKIETEKVGIRKSKITAKASLNKLLEKKVVEIREIPVSHIPQMVIDHLSSFELTDAQNQVYEEIINSDDKTFLLNGVTGSGKTEIYLHLTDYYLKQNKSVLILVPEIALTDQMEMNFESRFEDTISILNSSLSDSRKYDEYQRILHGESKIVLGTRSAVFAPLENIGMIIIDEEHSPSYKQDTAPYYDAINVAILRARQNGAKVLLASATPRIIDMARATKNIYHPLYLKKRIAVNQEKDIIIVDMNKTENLDLHKSSLISIPLINEIKKNIERHEQAMILLNRRGFSPIYLCRDCQKSYKCPNCNIPMNYHKREDVLQCHHCGYRISAIGVTCQNDGCTDFTALGYGTQRAYEELKSLFPNAKITRLDSDISSNNIRHEILEDVRSGDTDILIGTEIIAKGHDFPRVSLACMLDADSPLRLPTYMANESCFDLISQFVGRAGRKNLKGRVLLQTYTIDNKVIEYAAKQDYDSFYEYEMGERKKYQYPPYTYLTSIQLRGVDNKKVNMMAEIVKNTLISAIGKRRFNVLGPSSPYIPYRNGRFYKMILLKYKDIKEAMDVLDSLDEIIKSSQDVDISINVDCGEESI